jgi:HlyD family secretion protein
LLKDDQAIQSATQAVTTAKGQLTNARLTAEANLRPQTPDEIAQAMASRDSAQVQVDSAQDTLDETTLTAPQAGVVLAVNGKVGESSGTGNNGDSNDNSSGSGSGSGSSTVSAASSATDTAGDGFITIANLSQLAVTANIAEADAANVQVGQPVTITFPATSSTATGSVFEVTPQSTVTNNVVLYPVKVALDAAPPGVGVGATASVSITTGTATNVLQAPNAAITSLGNNHTVTVRRNGVDAVVLVQIGRVGDTETEIISGLNQGDVLVLPTPAAPATTAGGGGGFPRLGGGR